MPLVILYHDDALPYNLGNCICNQRIIVQKKKIEENREGKLDWGGEGEEGYIPKEGEAPPSSLPLQWTSQEWPFNFTI